MSVTQRATDEVAEPSLEWLSRMQEEDQLEMEEAGKWFAEAPTLYGPPLIVTHGPRELELSVARKFKDCDICKMAFPFAQRLSDRGPTYLQPFRPHSGRGMIGLAGQMNVCPSCLPEQIDIRLSLPVRCGTCKETKSADNFRIETRASSGPMRVPICHDCRSFKARQSNYGMTRVEYMDLLMRQNGVCAICKGPPTSERGGRLHVDHCHSDGHIRGLLCAKCNYGLGYFKDDTIRMRAALKYLEEDSGYIRNTGSTGLRGVRSA